MTATLPPLRYLSAADVVAAMPALPERLVLARLTLEALVADAQLPAKIGVAPRPGASFGHAMPAWLRGAAPDGADDLLGVKWVVGFPTNAAMGLPAIHGTIVLSDARTGVLQALLDAGPITAQRTAAVSGVVIGQWAPAVTGRACRVAIVGAGIQALSHVPVVAHLLPGCTLTVHDRDPQRAQALVRVARATHAIGDARVADDAPGAIAGADVVLTLVSFGAERQAVPASAFSPGALIVAVDYDMCVPASVAHDAGLFLTDERSQLLANRAAGIFAGYPDAGATIGEALQAATPRPGRGRVLATHLGVGLADVVFGAAVLRNAEALGLGTVLPR